MIDVCNYEIKMLDKITSLIKYDILASEEVIRK